MDIVTSDVTGGVAVLRLNDPGRRNALSYDWIVAEEPNLLA